MGRNYSKPIIIKLNVMKISEEVEWSKSETVFYEMVLCLIYGVWDSLDLWLLFLSINKS